MSKPKRLQIDDALLKRFSEGRLDSEMEVSVAVAIENSPELQARIAAISSDGFLNRVKEIATASRMANSVAAMQHTVKSRLTTSDDSSSPTFIEGVPQELIESPDYQVLKELGRGGMGVVYAAKYLPMDRMEVLKVLNDRMVQKEAAKQRFISEMKAIGKLNHPFIATAYQRVVLPTQLVFSMEYVPGIDLHKFVQKHHPLPISVACTLASHIATALQHAHSRKMVHRDIKPSNVMVFKEDGKLQIKILDFGLAKATSEQQTEGLTANGTMLGTPEYMAPEQALDAASADIRADIYSLGCTLYHLLMGKPPFTGTYQSVLMAHAQKEADCISFERLDVPIELSEIVAKMMAKEPAKRFQLPNAVTLALKPYIGPEKLNRMSATKSSAKIDTKLNLASPSLDTSVEIAGKRIQKAEPDKQNELMEVSKPVANRQASARPQSSLRRPSKTNGRRVSPRKAVPRRAATIAIGGLVLALLVYFSTLMFKTEHGTLVFENLPKDAIVSIDGERVTISNLKNDGTAEVRIAPGAHKVEVKLNGLVVGGESVSIGSGKDERITISIQQDAVIADEMTADTMDHRVSEARSGVLSAGKTPGTPSNLVFPIVEQIGDWTCDAGIVQQHQLGKAVAALCFGDKEWKNYDFSFSAKRISGTHGFKALFHWQDQDNQMMFGLGNYLNRGHDVSYELNGSWGRHPYGHYVILDESSQIEIGRWYRVEVRVRESHYECLLDGVLICEGANDRLSSGCVGLGTWDSNSQFKDIVVSSPEGKLLLSGVPDLKPANAETTSENADE